MSESTDNPSIAPVASRPGDPRSQAGTSATRRPAEERLCDALECVVLPARDGAPPSDRPPVEIFLGTEPAQYRANRVFGWSIEKARDPGREVRIYLLSELTGFDRRGWTTGFTNFRFSIPAYKNGRGRAIYNDEDQIYLTDPAELFDLDLGEAAHLSISDTESSVMLIDCERMSKIWTLHDAQHLWKRALLRRATKETGLRGDLDPGWNARDEEFEPGVSHLLHYTTLHTQPWRPFPERFVYQNGSHTDLWHDLEREAIANGFEFFRRETPSRGFQVRLADQRKLAASEMGSGIGVSGELAGAVEQLARQTKSRSLLEISPDLNGDGEQSPGRFGLDRERRLGLVDWLDEATPPASHDGVICVDGLEAMPLWDIPWLIDSLFRSARRFVFVAVRCPEALPKRRFLLPPQGTTHTPDWWRSHFDAASSRYPTIRWELMTARGNAFDSDCIHLRRGGPRPEASPPTVWTLTDRAPGNDTQISALVSALGWPSLEIKFERGKRLRLPFSGLGTHLRGLRADTRSMTMLEGPWPDLLIVAGRRVAPAARWIRRASRGRTQIVAIGTKASTPARDVDLALTPKGAALFPHPRRMEIDRPLVSHRRAPGVSARWRDRIQAIPGRRIVLLLGSGTRRLGLDASASEALARLVAESAAELGASLLVSSSRHCAPETLRGCLRAIGDSAAIVHHETRDQLPEERAWGALLEAGDAFVYFGLGETTLAEICATGRPVFLAPQMPSHASIWERGRDVVAQAIVARSLFTPENDRGTTRPQQRLELLCARLVDGGWVRPRRDAEALRGRLVRSGHARLLRAPIRAGDLVGFAAPTESELPIISRRIKEMLGVESELAMSSMVSGSDADEQEND